MKRLLIPICLVLFTAGCTKNYKTVDEYQFEMQKIKSTNGSYTIEAEYSTTEGNVYLKNLQKGNKWKNQLSLNEGVTYLETTMFDGNEILKYKDDTKLAVTIPNPDNDNNFHSLINPVISLFEWEKDIFSFANEETSSSEFIKQKDIKNDFPCRLIKYTYSSGAQKEVCVSDKYGIAVYSKYTTTGEKAFSAELNVVKVDTEEISDSEFQLPKDVKKMDFQQLMSQLNASLQELKQY